MTLPSYPAYKESEIDWLGAVPENWDSKRLKFLFNLVKREIREEDRIVTCFRDGAVTLRDNRRTDGFTNALKEIGYQGIRTGDLVIHAMDAFAGAIGVSDSDGKSSPVYSVCTPVSPIVSASYYARLLRNMAVAGFVSSLAKGIRERSSDFRWADAGEIYLPVPPEQEQKTIVKFLDHETARIDALIKEQQRLIELLKEKRQAVISDAVTKGLDTTAPMKDSGVEWLGEVPTHWEVKPLRYVSTMIDGDRSSAYPSEGDLVDEGIPFVSSKNIVGYKFTDKNLNFITQDKFNSLGRGKLCDGDLVITVRGTIGHVAVFDSAVIGSNTGFINAQMMIIRPFAGLTEYIRLCSESHFWQKQLDVSAYGSTVKQLSNPIVGGLIIALPPREEIPDLVCKVRALECEFETLISEALIGTNLLQERRSALISAAVTGKIDVRAWQPASSAPSPELAQEAL